MVGRLIGLAVLNGEKVSVGFAGIVWKLLVGGLDDQRSVGSSGESGMSGSRRRRRGVDDEGREGGSVGKRRRRGIVDVEDLKGVDDALGKSLEWVRCVPSTAFAFLPTPQRVLTLFTRHASRSNDPSILCRSFTYDVDTFGTSQSIPLRPNGEEIDVTEENKEEYVRAMARFVLLENVRAQTEAMLKGLDEVVQRRYLSTLKPDEMEVRPRPPVVDGSSSVRRRLVVMVEKLTFSLSCSCSSAASRTSTSTTGKPTRNM